MIRILVGGQGISSRRLGHQMIEKHPEVVEVVELPFLEPFTDPATLPKKKLLELEVPFADSVFWPDEYGDERVESIVVLESGVFLEGEEYSRQAKVLCMPITKTQLKSFQPALMGSGLRLFAYGSTDDQEARKFEIVRANDTPPEEKEDHPLLGQVNIETGEIMEAAP